MAPHNEYWQGICCLSFSIFTNIINSHLRRNFTEKRISCETELLNSFRAALFIILYKMVLTFESAGEILLCDLSLSKKLPSNALPWCNSFLQHMPKLLKIDFHKEFSFKLA